MNINDLISRVSEYDKNLAKDLSEYVRGREYGLVYEASKPEFVRLWNKPIVRGDLVNILPPRGVVETGKSEDAPSMITYRYISKNGDKAKLRDIKTQEECRADVEDLVAIARFDQPIYCGLRERDRVERSDDDSYHVVINGENYHALQTLTFAYAGKVDCIYIDPPYNSGAKDWKYNNNYVSGDDTYRHSKWLTFMEDRLRIAKKLLNPRDSVLIVTIDEKEYARLGLLLEQIFPEGRIQMVSDVINPRGTTREGQFSRTDEYIYFVEFGESSVVYPTDGNDTRNVEWYRLRRPDFESRRGTTKGGVQQFYPIYVDDKTMKIIKIGDPILPEVDRRTVPQIEGATTVFPIRNDGVEMNWAVTPDTLQRLLDANFVRVRKNKKKEQPYLLHYISYKMLDAIKEGRAQIKGYNEDGTAIVVETAGHIVRPGTAWNVGSHNAGSYGTEIMTKFLTDKRFNYPKSLYSVADVLRYYVVNKPNALIVDFFAGSGTTLHAVNYLNSEDNGHRRCICVTNNEVSEKEEKEFTAKKLRPSDEEWSSHGIANYVTWPRTKCSILGCDVNGSAVDGTYMNTNAPMADGFKSNAVLFELTYLEPSVIAADLAFDEIAPILWLRSECRGEVLRHTNGYVIGKTYAVIFDYSFINEFNEILHLRTDITHVFIVTDTKSRYRNLYAEFPERDVVQLYESYIRSFEINTEV